MSLRVALRDKPAVGGVLIAAILGLAGYIVYAGLFAKRPSPKPRVDRLWYYDLDNKNLFMVNANDPNAIPPVKSPAGGKSVRAMVYACGACEGEALQVGYLESYTDEAKDLQVKKRDGIPITAEERQRIEKGRIVADPADLGTWLPVNSKEGLAIVEARRAPHDKCKEGNGASGKWRGCVPPTGAEVKPLP